MIKRKLLPTIEKVDLLTVEEAGKLPLRLRKYARWWWLRSTTKYSYNAACVSPGGHVIFSGDYVNGYDNAVRPALRITNLNDYKIDSLFKFGGHRFEIIDENTAFCLSDIGNHKFDEETNVYEKSEIKAFVEEWYESARK